MIDCIQFKLKRKLAILLDFGVCILQTTLYDTFGIYNILCSVLKKTQTNVSFDLYVFALVHGSFHFRDKNLFIIISVWTAISHTEENSNDKKLFRYTWNFSDTLYLLSIRDTYVRQLQLQFQNVRRSFCCWFFCLIGVTFNVVMCHVIATLHVHYITMSKHFNLCFCIF